MTGPPEHIGGHGIGDWTPSTFWDDILALFQAIVGGQITLTINCYSQQDFSTFRRPYCAPTFFRGIDIIDNRQEA